MAFRFSSKRSIVRHSQNKVGFFKKAAESLKIKLLQKVLQNLKIILQKQHKSFYF